MLVEFRVENYRSFGDVQRLSMTAGSVKNHPRHVVMVGNRKILVASAVFGANASGKTNLVRAMVESQAKIVAGIPVPIASWNRNDNNNRDAPTGFEYVFTMGETTLAYGFEIVASTGVVKSEWLHDMTHKDVAVFDRDGRAVITGDDSDTALKGKVDVIASMLRVNGGDLILPLLARMEGTSDAIFEKARLAMSWFSHNLVIIGAENNAPVMFYEGRDDVIRDAMSSYATGITGIGYERMKRLPQDVPEVLVRDMEQQLMRGAVGAIRGPQGFLRLRYEDGLVAERTVFYHNSVKFDFNEESDGTRRLFDLLPVIERNEVRDVTFVIDELNRSLHPQLSRKFVRDFLKLSVEKRRQLIFTTHEAMLLDLDLLRRDEYWFAEKTSEGNTRLYSLEDFRERADRRIIWSYLDGRYGAVPAFREMYPDLE